MMQCPKNTAELEDRLSTPTPGVIEAFSKLDGDLIILGVAGKMGPSLARMAKRASDLAGRRRTLIGVSRFSNLTIEHALSSTGVRTINCDLLDEGAINALPDVPNVLFLAGMKFGSTGQESMTWAMNSYLPALVCNKYSRSRIVAFSTGNVYGLVPAKNGGSVETDLPAPVGEYAMSCLGRERIFEYFSRKFRQSQALIRLNYACDLRYGVLVDLAHKIWTGKPVDVAMSCFNTIWQGDANALALQAFDLATTPSLILNVTGPESLSVRDVCLQFGDLMDRKPHFTGSEAPTALLNNSSKAMALFGQPRISSEQLIRWVTEWVMRGGESLSKPTHFESRDGRF